MNIVLIQDIISREMAELGQRFWAKVIILTIIILSYIVMQILPIYERGLKARLQLLMGGYELILTALYCLFAEIAGILLYFLYLKNYFPYFGQIPLHVHIINTVVAMLVLFIHYQNGFWRTAFCSSQLGLGRRILMLIFWWIFPINIVLFRQWCSIVRREIIFETDRYRLDNAREENEICRTHYPVVMVHGIFFRDWLYMNYWGRIPQALKSNGANVYYGKQQSSLPVAESAKELEAEIRRILQETGAEKVNIVAHSKGGLDARYAITHLGLADCVASLTTINTPHRGCQFADVLLKTMPKGLLHFIEKRYNALYHRLGDPTPDFLGGVSNLTASACAEFNESTPDSPSVYYQSVMSRMRSCASAGFPLNLSYLYVKKYDGANDGLVGVDSARWGHYLGLLTAGRQGISHGDMIDLTHKNIRGFDVSEFYVQLLAGLKEKGF